MADNYYFRLATMDDMDLIYKWANEPLVRANSFNSEPIPYENHVKWYSALMSDSATNIQLIFISDNKPIGQCRLKVTDGIAEIGYSLDFDSRGRGQSVIMITALTEWLQNNRPDIASIIAKVKPENKASIATFLRCDYTEDTLSSDITDYRQFSLLIQ